VSKGSDRGEDSSLGVRAYKYRDDFDGKESAENIRHDEFLPDGRSTEVCWSEMMKI
jgi:hypothetical protein